MKEALMTNLGVDDRTATALIAGSSSNVLDELIQFVVAAGPYARGAVLAALPFLMKGDYAGAFRAMAVYLLGYIPDSGVPQHASPPAPIPTAESIAKDKVKEAEAALKVEHDKAVAAKKSHEEEEPHRAESHKSHHKK